MQVQQQGGEERREATTRDGKGQQKERIEMSVKGEENGGKAYYLFPHRLPRSAILARLHHSTPHTHQSDETLTRSTS